MLERKPKQNNKPLSIYYLCRIQKLRNITNKSLKFSATDLKYGKHHYKYLAAGKAEQWKDCMVSRRRVWLQHFYQCKGKAGGLSLPWQCFILHFSWCRALHRLQTAEDWSLGSAPLSPWPLAPGLLPPSSECWGLDLAARGAEALECSDWAAETIKITNYRAQWE